MGFLYNTCSSTEFLVSQTEERTAGSIIGPHAATMLSALWHAQSGNRQNSIPFFTQDMLAFPVIIYGLVKNLKTEHTQIKK
jgi:hypothetical protein